jgi:hypothetical protein
MKQIYLVAIVLSLFFSVKSQDRVNKSPIVWDAKSQPLTTSVGWILNDKTGKWVSSPNLIKEEFWDIDYSQQFNSIQFRTFKYNEKNYYTLIVKKVGVYWDYPTIGRGHHTFPQHCVYILTEDEFNKIKTLDSVCILKMQLANSSEYYDVVYKKQNPESFITGALRQNLEKTGIDYGFYNMKIIKTKSNGKYVYRFLLPTNSYISENIDLSSKYFEIPSISSLVTLSK